MPSPGRITIENLKRLLSARQRQNFSSTTHVFLAIFLSATLKSSWEEDGRRCEATCTELIAQLTRHSREAR